MKRRKSDYYVGIPLAAIMVGALLLNGSYLVACVAVLSTLFVFERTRPNKAGPPSLRDVSVGRSEDSISRAANSEVAGGALSVRIKAAVAWMRAAAMSRYAAILLVLMALLTGVVLNTALRVVW